jgi:hypothetical protein
MKSIFSGYHGFWNYERKRSLYLGVLLIILSLIIQISAGHYSSRRASSANFAGDLFLDNLPTINLDFIIMQGAILFWVGSSLLLATRPRQLLLGIKAIALFIIFRAFFISLTHIGIYPRQIAFNDGNIGYGLYNLVTFQGNFFFSGHVGFPFLMALLFYNSTKLRRFFLFMTFLFGASVLLAHAHYSIDVFAAPFITYGIFQIAAKLFPRDYALLASREP